MSTTPEATSYHSSRKFSILLPLRTIQNLSFHYETPCIMLIMWKPLIMQEPLISIMQEPKSGRSWTSKVFKTLITFSKRISPNCAGPFLSFVSIGGLQQSNWKCTRCLVNSTRAMGYCLCLLKHNGVKVFIFLFPTRMT